jgi:hypothetical protein
VQFIAIQHDLKALFSQSAVRTAILAVLHDIRPNERI